MRLDKLRKEEFANSKKIAGLLGPSIVVLVVSEVMNAHIWINVTAVQTYLAGALWFVAGFAILRSHNLWVFDWRMCITFMGWFITFGGLSRMFFPEVSKEGAQNAPVVFALQMALLVVGIFLTYKAYIKGDTK